MWLENLKELKKAKGMTSKQISDATKIPESTIKRIFSGETDDPYVSTIHRIVTVLGGSLDNILADTNAVLSKENIADIKENTAELEMLRAKTIAQETEILLLKEQLKHKEELLALINYFAKVRPIE